jgi:uncharacterized protein
MIAACGKAAVVVAPQAQSKSSDAASDVGGWDDSSKSCGGKNEPKATRLLIRALSTDERVELEASMSKGIAFLSYSDDCKSLRLLSSCSRREHAMTAAAYKFVGRPMQASVVEGKSGDGRSATSLEVAIVGELRTDVDTIDRSELDGDCSDATHFLRSATVGAVSLNSHSGAGTSRSHNESMQDGSLAACRQASPASRTAPFQCRVPIRAELVRINR